MLDVTDKDGQATMINLFKEQQKIMFKRLKESMSTNPQIENHKKRNYKTNKWKSGVEKNQ